MPETQYDPRIQLNVYLDASSKEWLVAEAMRRDLSLSQLVRLLIREERERRGNHGA